MVIRKSLYSVFGAFVFLAALTPGLIAQDSAAHTTYLTFSGPVHLPGVALGSGTYIFELADPVGGSGAVRVMSRDRRHAYFMGLTHRVDRPAWLTPNAMVSLGEAAPGSTPPITAWFPLGESTGHAFLYR